MVLLHFNVEVGCVIGQQSLLLLLVLLVQLLLQHVLIVGNSGGRVVMQMQVGADAAGRRRRRFCAAVRVIIDRSGRCQGTARRSSCCEATAFRGSGSRCRCSDYSGCKFTLNVRRNDGAGCAQRLRRLLVMRL